MSKIPEKFKNDDEIKTYNPWKKLAEDYDKLALNDDCLYGQDNKYYCEDDLSAINDFNKKWKGTTDEIITTIPVEPWWGNPLEAKLIILTLNPGYVPEVNESLAKLLQSNKIIRQKLMAYKKKTLLLEAESFLPEDDVKDIPISLKEAVNMLDDWYWYEKLKSLRKEVEEKYKLTEDEFFKHIALIEYHGYSSIKSDHEFPLKNKKTKFPNYLETQIFIKKMIWYLAEKKDVRFLIMRSKTKWKNLLNDGWLNLSNDNQKTFLEIYNDNNNGVIFYKTNNGMSQAITKKNLGQIYEKLKKIFE